MPFLCHWLISLVCNGTDLIAYCQTSESRLSAFFILLLLLLPVTNYYVTYIYNISDYMVRVVHSDMPSLCLL